MFYLVGYSLMYVDVPEGGWMGTFSFLYNSSEAELALLGAEKATDEMTAAVTGNGYSVMSDWFFQMVFVATAASIVSGTLAERIKVWPFLIFVVFLSAIIYPIQASWVWGGGVLAEMGFSDFAGSTLVHSTGGWAALTGAIILGAPRIIAPVSAAQPPVECTRVDPAKSEKPISANTPPPQTQEA